MIATIECLMFTVVLVSGILIVSLIWLALEAVMKAILKPFVNMYKTFKGTINDVNT